MADVPGGQARPRGRSKQRPYGDQSVAEQLSLGALDLQGWLDTRLIEG
jgi:hypothetical protein